METDKTLRDVCAALQNTEAVSFARQTAAAGYRQFFPDSIAEVEAMVDKAYDRLVASQRGTIDTRALADITRDLLEQIFHRGDPAFWFNRTYHHYKAVLKPRVDVRFLAPLVRGSRILDYGCGSGYLSARLAQEGYQVFTTDVLDYRLEEARGLPFARMSSATDIEYPPDSMDTALVQAVLHHIDLADLPAVLGGLARITRRLIIKEDVLGVSAETPGIVPDAWRQDLFRQYVGLSSPTQFQTMVLIDYYSNALAQGIPEMNMPFAFRSVQEWQTILTANGFSVAETRVTGFEEARMHTSCYAWFVCDRRSLAGS
jgi:SAM-dependent methyltransferase